MYCMHRIFIMRKKIRAMKTLKALKYRLEHLNLGKLLRTIKIKKDEPRTIITASFFDDEDLFMFI